MRRVRFTLKSRHVRRTSRMSLSTLHEPQIERREYQDKSDVHHQPFPEPIPEEQDVHADNDGYQRERVKHDGCLSSHPAFLVLAAEQSQRDVWRQSRSRISASGGHSEE
jgi:hypothetical protein